MGLDLYIEAKITEKATGRCISVYDNSYSENSKAFKGHIKNREEDEEYDWFGVVWTFGDNARRLRNSWIEIINRYMKTEYLNKDFIIPLPQSALREICSSTFSYACLPEENRFADGTECGFWDIEQREKENNIPYSVCDSEDTYRKWDYLSGSENHFLLLAESLRDLIYLLERINYENKYIPLKSNNDGLCETGRLVFVDEYITEKTDLEKFKADPQAYEWSFRIWNSY